MSASKDWREVIAQIAKSPTPGCSPDLPRLYHLACDEARRALRTFHEGIRAQADDLVHEHLFLELKSILEARQPKAYFVTMIRNAALTEWRREQRLVHEDVAQVDHEPVPPKGVEEGVVARAEIERCWALLSHREREIFSAIATGEDRDDIADALEISRANLDQIVSRARRRLQEGA